MTALMTIATWSEYAHRMRINLGTRSYLFDDLKTRTIPHQ
jgi:hypothetical protein